MKISDILDESNNQLQVKLIKTSKEIESALKLEEKTFGHLDLAGSTVREELANISWSESAGLFDSDDNCLSEILMSNTSFKDYLETVKGEIPFNPTPLLNLSCLCGDSLIVTSEARSMVTAMFRKIVANSIGIDFFYGTAHSDLNNMEFWKKHSIVLGMVNDGTETNVFVLPLSHAAKVAVKKIIDK